MSEAQPRNVRNLGLICLSIAALALAAAAPLRCLWVAVRVGAGSLCAGFGLGLSLALVTRTRRPWLIYLGLALAGATLVPLIQEWPPGDAWDVHPWHGASPLAYSYLDGLRTLMYLLGIPWPFARFGHHAPDPIPERISAPNAEETEQNAESKKP